MYQRIASLLTTSAQRLLMALVIIVPFVFLPVAWATVPQVKIFVIAVAVLLIVLCWSAAILIRRTSGLPVSIIIIAGLTLPVAYAVSAVIASGGSVTALVGTGAERDTVAAMVIWFASMAAAAGLVSSGRTVVQAVRAIITIVGITALLHLLRLLIGPGLFSLGGLITGPSATLLGSWHNLGIFLGFGVVTCGIMLASSAVAGSWRRITLGSLVLTLITLAVLNQQDVWIVLALTTAIAGGYLWFLGWKQRSVASTDGTAHAPGRAPVVQAAGVLLGTAVLAVIFALAGSVVQNVLPDRIQVAQAEVRPSWEGTATVAASVYESHSLLFGSGPNSFVREWGFYKPAGVNETAFWGVDFSQGIGFIPTAAVTVGGIGLLAWALFLLTILISGARSLVRRRQDERWHIVLLALFAGIVYLWAMHIIYPPGSTVLAISFLFTGIFIAAQGIRTMPGSTEPELSQTRSWIRYTTFTLHGALVVAVVLATFGIGRAVVADMYVNKSITIYNATSDFKRASDYLATAQALNPSYDRALRATVELNLLRFESMLAEGVETEEEQIALAQVLRAAIENGLGAVSLNSENYQNWLTLAAAYERLAGVEVEGAITNARTAYERAAQENPTSPVPYLQLARIAAAQNELDVARTYLTQSLARKPNYAPAHYLRSQLEVTAGNLDAARTAAEAVVQNAPNESIAWFQLGAILYAQDEYEDAVAILEQAVARNANYANALYVLGLAYRDTGQIENAIAALERVDELSPGNTVVTQLLEQLRTQGETPEEDVTGA